MDFGAPLFMRTVLFFCSNLSIRKQTHHRPCAVSLYCLAVVDIKAYCGIIVLGIIMYYLNCSAISLCRHGHINVIDLAIVHSKNMVSLLY